MITTGVLIGLIGHGIRCLYYDLQQKKREAELKERTEKKNGKKKPAVINH
jgi:hypothetical protein